MYKCMGMLKTQIFRACSVDAVGHDKGHDDGHNGSLFFVWQMA